jgi:hypothetical protein
MAHFPGTPKLESRKCPGLESRNFGSSYLRTAKSDQGEVSTKVIALFESFPTPCRTLDSDVGKRSTPTFSGRESNCQFDSRPFFCP